MQIVVDTPKDKVVRITFTSSILLQEHLTLLQTLSTYSLDNGPDPSDTQKVSFRFIAYDWHKTIEELLMNENIPALESSEPGTDGYIFSSS